MKRLSNNTVAFIVCTVIICDIIALIRLDAGLIITKTLVEPLNTIFYELTISREMQDLKEIQANVAECQNEYQSEMGFGNDRFTIYSFSLKSTEKLGTLHRLDKGFEETYTNYLELIDMELVMAKPFKKVKLLALKHILEKMPQTDQEQLYYSHHITSSSTKSYLYNSTTNKGYCLIIII